MSIGPTGGILGSAAGAPGAQLAGADVERAKQDGVNHARQVASNKQAENAAGIAETDGKDHETNERDADGRRPWEIPARAQPPADASAAAEPAPASKDATGQCGNELDLTG